MRMVEEIKFARLIVQLPWLYFSLSQARGEPIDLDEPESCFMLLDFRLEISLIVRLELEALYWK